MCCPTAGVAAGYATEDLAAFGVTPTERGRRMEDGLHLIRAVWTGEPVTVESPQSRLVDYAIFPRPLQRPAPPIYIGALSDRAIHRAARLGDGFVLSAGSTLEEIRSRIPVYRAALRALGRDPSTLRPLALNRVVHVVDGRAERDAAMRAFAERFLAFYDRWGHGDVRRLGSVERGWEETARAHFVIGEPTECVEQIRRYEELGIGHLACLMNFGKPPLEAVDASLRRFAAQVLPHFR